MRSLLSINGHDYAIDAAPSAPLLAVLRDDLALTGARAGCGEGRCGACHVLLDGVAVPACTTTVGAAAGHAIVTIEGLGAAGTTPVQDAFLAEGAMQCGFCTSGMVIAATALIARMPDPSDDDIRDELVGHLCRCGGYGRVVRAVRRAAGRSR